VDRKRSMERLTFLVMRLRSRIIVFALLAALTSASPAMPMSRHAAAAPERAAGCHQHGQPAPASVPVSYKCCVVGHHPALLVGSFVPSPAVAGAVSCRALPEVPSASPSSVTPLNPLLELYDPPGTAILRI